MLRKIVDKLLTTPELREANARLEQAEEELRKCREMWVDLTVLHDKLQADIFKTLKKERNA